MSAAPPGAGCVILETDPPAAARADALASLYGGAHQVYGLAPHALSARCFRDLRYQGWHGELVRRYTAAINGELAALLARSGVPECALLNRFVCNSSYDTPTFLLATLAMLGERHPGAPLVVVTRQLALCTLAAALPPGACPPARWIVLPDPGGGRLAAARAGLRRWLARSRPGFALLEAFNLLRFLLQVVRCARPGSRTLPAGGLLCLSSHARYWVGEGERVRGDHYLPVVLRQPRAADPRSRVALMHPTREPVAAPHQLHHLTRWGDLAAALGTALVRFAALLPWLEARHRVFQGPLLVQLFQVACLTRVLRRFRPKAVLYYDMMYASGRGISLAAAAAGVVSLGYQHAFPSRFHPVKYFLELAPDHPRLVSDWFLVFGPYSRELFAGMGYPRERLVPVGLDRVVLTPAPPPPAPPPGGPRLLYLGSASERDDFDAFAELYRCYQALGFGELVFRCHPARGRDAARWRAAFPQAYYVAPGAETLAENIARCHAVLCVGGSTALIDAVLAGRQAFCWARHGHADIYDLSRWGVQVVADPAQLDPHWRVDPAPLRAEMAGQVALLPFLTRLLAAGDHPAESGAAAEAIRHPTTTGEAHGGN